MARTPSIKTEADLDDALDATFSCSDPPAWGRAASVAGCAKPPEMVAADLRRKRRQDRAANPRERPRPVATKYEDWEAGGGPAFEPDYRRTWESRSRPLPPRKPE